MTTKTTPPRELTCSMISLTIEILDVRYSVDAIPPGEDGTHAFRLTKRAAGHETYDVIRHHDGLIECSCPDYEFRHRNTEEACKHGTALVNLGLVPAPCAACTSTGDEEARDHGQDDEADAWHLGDDHDDDLPELETAEDLAEYQAWRDASVAREHLDASARLTLDELVERQAEFFDGWGNPAGSMLAAAMRDLGFKVRLTDATTPDEFAARIAVLDADARNTWESAGYLEGMAVGRSERSGSGFGHDA